jgi:L-amino acid N-acyltransferase YncA
MSYNIVPQNTVEVKTEPYQSNTGRADILALADHALQEFNRHWAAWIVTGDNTSYRLAVAARQDRADLLAQVGGGP